MAENIRAPEPLRAGQIAHSAARWAAEWTDSYPRQMVIADELLNVLARDMSLACARRGDGEC